VRNTPEEDCTGRRRRMVLPGPNEDSLPFLWALTQRIGKILVKVQKWMKGRSYLF
jgi:hypothetical protein